MWKSKQIDRVCHSSKDAETLAFSKMLDEVTFLARKIETERPSGFIREVVYSIDVIDTLKSVGTMAIYIEKSSQDANKILSCLVYDS